MTDTTYTEADIDVLTWAPHGSPWYDTRDGMLDVDEYNRTPLVTLSQIPGHHGPGSVVRMVSRRINDYTGAGGFLGGMTGDHQKAVY